MRWTTGSTVLPEIREAPRLWVQADWSSHSGEAGRGRRGRSGGWSSRRARSLPSCSLDAFDATSEQYQAFKKIILAKYENMKISEISNDEIWELIQELQTKKRWENMKCKQALNIRANFGKTSSNIWHLIKFGKHRLSSVKQCD